MGIGQGQGSYESFPGGSDSKKKKNLPAMQETQIQTWIKKIPWRRKWQPTLVFLPGEFHGQRSQAGYSSWGYKELSDQHFGALLVAQMVKNMPAMQKTQVQSLGWEDPSEKGTATHSSLEWVQKELLPVKIEMSFEARCQIMKLELISLNNEKL